MLFIHPTPLTVRISLMYLHPQWYLTKCLEEGKGKRDGEQRSSSGPELSQVEDKMGEKVGEMLGREPKGELWLARAVVAPISWMS